MGRSVKYVQQLNEGKKLAQNNNTAFLAPFSSHETTYKVKKPSTPSLPPPPPPAPTSSRSSAHSQSTRRPTTTASMRTQTSMNDGSDEGEEEEEDEEKSISRTSRAWQSRPQLFSGLSSALFNFTDGLSNAMSSAIAPRPSTSSYHATDLFDFDCPPALNNKRRQPATPSANPAPHTPSSAPSSVSNGTARQTARRPADAASRTRQAVLPSATPQSGPTTAYERWQALEKQSQQALNQPRSRRALGPLLIDDKKPKRPLAAARREIKEERVEQQQQVEVRQSEQAKRKKHMTQQQQPVEEVKQVEAAAEQHQRDVQAEEDETPLAAKLTATRNKRRAEPQPPTRPAKRRPHDDAVPSIPEPTPPAPRLSRNSKKAATPDPLPPAAPSVAEPARTAAVAVPEANDDYCAGCGHGGNLVMCAGCVQAWHFGCMHTPTYPTIDQVPDDWRCTQSHKKCTTRTQPKLETDTPSPNSELTHFRWTSQPTKRREGGRRYTSFRRGDESFKLGDVICICTEAADPAAAGGGTVDRIGEIVDAWQGMHGDRWLEVRWYWLPDETKHGRLPAHHAREVFGTAHMGEVEVDTIQSKVSVLTERCYAEREARGELDDCVFFCRKNYDHDRGDFKPLVASDCIRAGSGAGKRRRGGAAVGCEEDGEEWELDGAGGRARKHKRTIDNNADKFSQACTALQLSSLPATLPCREQEAHTIRAFLTAALRRGGQHGGGLYIAGVPGTGKTATVRQVLGELARRATGDVDVLEGDGASVPVFQFVEVNGMKLPDPSHAFTHIWQSLTGQHASPKRAMSLLDTRFRAKASRRPVCVLLLDEIDFCLTRSQQLLYALADWPTHPHSRLVTISISNTIDFPELLHERVRSRFVGEHVTFRPYRSAQVEEIIAKRLEAAGAGGAGGVGGLFEKDAITFAAKKIASINGDIRVALEICRRAAIIAQEQQQQQQHKAKGSNNASSKPDCVTMRTVQRAIAELQGSSEQELTRQCTPYQAALLAAIYCSNVAVSADAAVAVDFNGVSDRLRRTYVNRSSDGFVLTAGEVEVMANGMVGVGLLEWVGKGKGGDVSGLQVRLKMPPHLCEHALKDNVHWQAIVN